MFDHIIFLFGFLLHDTGFLYFLAPDDGAAVKDGHLAAVYLDEAVVDAGGVEGSHSVFDGAHAGFFVALIGDDGAACGLDDMFGKRLDSGLSLQVEAFEDVSGVHISRLECRGRHLSRVQALSFYGKGLLQCLLFHFQLLVFFFRSLMSLYISPRRFK